MSELTPVARRALAMLDLTSLNPNDTADSIVALCQQARSAAGTVAAVCIGPAFVRLARQTLNELGLAQVRVATVANFPHGSDDVAQAVAETRAAIAEGADEVDVVFPYRAFQQGQVEQAAELVEACKDACGEKTLKVILETGELDSPRQIRDASLLAIAAGADFIKTSTGTVAVGCTLEAAGIMLTAIRASGGRCGFKAAGQLQTVEQAAEYIDLAEHVMGAAWVTAEHFRFGSSRLLTALRHEITGA